MGHKRGDKKKKWDRQDHYAGLVKMSVEAMARWHYIRRPYTVQKLSEQARRLIRVQGRQMEHKSVDEYLAEKYDIKEKESTGGQEDS